MAEDEPGADMSRRRRDHAPIFGWWAAFSLAFTPHLAAAGAAVGYYMGGSRPLAVEQATGGAPGVESATDGLARVALLHLFPPLVLVMAAAVLLARLDRTWYMDLGRESLFAVPNPLLKLGLVLAGWGPLVACLVSGMRGPDRGVPLTLALSRHGWLGCAEGRGLIGLAAGLALGLAFTAWGLGHDLSGRAAPPEADNSADDPL